MIDLDGAISLLIAVVREWANEARRDPGELQSLADFLGMPPARVAEALSAMPNTSKRKSTHRK